MNSFSIDVSFPPFLIELKEAKKKFPSFPKHDLPATFEILEKNPRAGDQIPRVGADVFKIRIGVKGQFGKSGGYRLIYHVDMERLVITPIALYFKPDTPNLSDSEVAERFIKLLDFILQTKLDQIKSEGTPQLPDT